MQGTERNRQAIAWLEQQLKSVGYTNVERFRFIVQFSKDMDETTFSGRVMLRYRGAVQPGDRAFDGVVLTYDPGRRALTVDPRDVLRNGRAVELLLLPGILDTDGMALMPRPGRPDEKVAEGDWGAALAVDVFTYVIGG